jgi:hypothetical protein
VGAGKSHSGEVGELRVLGLRWIFFGFFLGLFWVRPQHVAKTAGCQKKPPTGVIFPSFGAILLIPGGGGGKKKEMKIGVDFPELRRHLLIPVSEWGLGLGFWV